MIFIFAVLYTMGAFGTGIAIWESCSDNQDHVLDAIPIAIIIGLIFPLCWAYSITKWFCREGIA